MFGRVANVMFKTHVLTQINQEINNLVYMLSECVYSIGRLLNSLQTMECHLYNDNSQVIMQLIKFYEDTTTLPTLNNFHHFQIFVLYDISSLIQLFIKFKTTNYLVINLT